MIASLMMYARPQLAEAHERYWILIKANLADVGIDSPVELSQNDNEFLVWKHPDLVLSQTCGMPYRLWLHDQVSLVGTPDYGVEGCLAGFYKSAFVVRHDDPRDQISEFRNGVFAYNQTFSQSGYAAPYEHLKQHGFWFEKKMQTEQHVLSARAVSEGRADIASLDAVTWRLLQQHEGFASGLRVLDWTKPTPGLPLITRKGQSAEHILDSVAQAIKQLDPIDRKVLGLKGIVKIAREDYLAVPNPTNVS